MRIEQIILLAIGVIVSTIGLKESFYYFGSGSLEDPQYGKKLLFSAVRSIAITLWGFAFVLLAIILNIFL